VVLWLLAGALTNSTAIAGGYGVSKAQRNMGLKFRDAGVPSLQEFRQAVAENKLVAICFTTT